ncbi:MAG: GTP 3',8-cyclase MoaA [Nitrososphaeria archaeon]
MPLRDPFGRPVTNLRISLTQRCNLKCFFCHEEGEVEPGAEMSTNEVRSIVEVAARLGVKKLKITGGEPLLRNDLCDVVSHSSGLMEEVSMTTNGVELEQWAARLRRAQLQRVNVSLHSLRRKRYRDITGVDALDKVLRGITAALDNGLTPVKVNFVVLRDVNHDEIKDMMNFAARTGAVLQVIEYMPLGNGKMSGAQYHVDLSGIESDLRRIAFCSEERRMHRRCRYFVPVEEGRAEVEVVRSMHNSVFCRNCTRLRVTSDGRFKPCLLRNDNLVDVASLLRRGTSRKKISEVFRKAVSLREPYWR